MKFSAVALAGFLAFVAAAPAAEEQDKRIINLCQMGQSKCTSDNTGIEVCKLGLFKFDKQCPYGTKCKANEATNKAECVADTPPECETGDSRCAQNGKSVETCKDGKYKPGSQCGSGKSCKVNEMTHKAECVADTPPECQTGDSRCSQDGKSVEACKDGKYKPDSQCQMGKKCKVNEMTHKAECVSDNPPECQTGDSRCSQDGKSVEACKDGKYKPDSQCQLGKKCKVNEITHKAECISDNPPECQNGDSRCSQDGTYTETCQNGKYKKGEECDQNEKCKVNEQSHKAECVRNEPPPECQWGESRCSQDGTYTETCQNGKFKKGEECDQYEKCKVNEQSHKAECVRNQPPPECQWGQSRCSQDGTYTETCKNGKYQKAEKCDHWESCKINAQSHKAECVKKNPPQCRWGESRCSQDRTYTETCKDGKFQKAEKCDHWESCKINAQSHKAECVKKNPPQCRWGESRCSQDGTYTETCKNGKFQKAEKCDHWESCKVNAQSHKAECVNKQPPQCHWGQSRCSRDGTYTETCMNGRYQVDDRCDHWEQCKVDSRSHKAECVPKRGGHHHPYKCRNNENRCGHDGHSWNTCKNGVFQFGGKCPRSHECRIKKDGKPECVPKDKCRYD